MKSARRFRVVSVAAGLILLALLPAAVCGQQIAQRSLPIQRPLLPQISPLPGQLQTIRFTRLTAEDGLSQNAVLAIVQDFRGFMWFGTEDGLNRFDGYQFTVYKHDPEEPTSLADSYISVLYQDHRGDLWIGTRNGLDRFEWDHNTFTHYRHDPDDPQSLGGTWIEAIAEDRSGTLWVGTEDGGLNRLDRDSNTFVRYRHDPDNPNSLADDTVTAIYEDRAGTLWVGTASGLDRLDRTTDAFVHVIGAPAGPLGASGAQSSAEGRVSTVLEDQDGALWVATEGEGLYRLDLTSLSVENYRNDPDDPDSLGHDRVRALLEDQAGRLWVGTQNGLDLLDRTRDRFLHFRHDPYDLHSLSGDTVWSIYQDRTAMLWFGTYQGGLSQYSGSANRFALYQQRPGQPDSLSDPMVWAIYEDQQGIVWVGTFNGGLNRLDRSTNTFTVYQHDPEIPTSLSSNDVRAILEDHTGTLWVGTQGGLDRFDRQTETFEHYRHDPDDPTSLSENRVTVLFEDRSGSLWVGTRSGGLDRWDRASGTFAHYRHDPEDPSSLGDDRVWALYEDRSGSLWVGTLGGLDRWDPLSDRFSHYGHDPDDATSLSNDGVFSLHEDAEGVLWVGTWGGGLNRLDPTRETFTHYTEQEGLPSNVIYGIEADAAGNLWLSTNHGLSRFDPRTETFRNYTIRDGLQDNEFNTGAHFRSPSGELFFGGVAGMNAFYPERVRGNPYPPPLVITAFSLFNQQIRTNLCGGEEIELSYRDDWISFEFAALDYTDPTRNRYSYMLAGQDDGWIDAGSRRYASYTNLRPGRYLFQVRGSNSDGVWNVQGVAVHLIVSPPFWETWWFRALAAFVVLGGTVAAYRWRVHRIEAQSRELARQVREQTGEIMHRTQELEALNRIAAVVSRSLDVQEVLNDALDKTLEVTEVEAGGVYLLQEDSGLLTIVTSRGLSPQLVSAIDNLAVGEGFSGRVVQTGEPIVVNDIASDPRLTRSVIREERFRSTGVFPLASRGKTLGSFFVITRSQREFSPQDIDLLTAIGRQIGVAMENARLFEAEQRRAEQFRVIGEVGRRIASILSVDELLAQVARLIQEAFSYYRVGIGLIEGEEVVFRGGAGGSWDEGRFQPLRMGIGQAGITDWMSRGGELLLVRDVRQESRCCILPESDETRSHLAVPLKVKDQVIGLLDAESDRLDAFDESDLTVLQSLGDQIAIAIENARLFEAEKRRAEQFQVISEVGRRMVSILAVDELLQEVVCLLKQTLGYYLVGVGLIEGDELVFKAGAGSVWDQPGFQPPRIRVGQEGITGWVAQSGEPLLVPDVSQEPRYYSLPEASEIRSELAVPLTTKERIIGVLHVQSDRLKAFDESDLMVLQSLAHQAAIAVDNARLFEQARCHTEELAVLNELGQALTARLDVDQVLEEAYRGASRLLEASSFYIALYDRQEGAVTFALDVTEGQVRKPYVTRKAGRGLTEYIIHTRAPLLIEERVPERLQELGIEQIGPVPLAWLGVPLMVSDQELGVMAVQSYTRPQIYSEHDRDLLTAIASQAAIAIQNALLFEAEQERFEESERRRQVAEGLRDIVAVLNSNRPLDEVLAYIAGQACQMMNARASLIYHVEREQERVTVEASCGIPLLVGRRPTTKIYDGYADRAIFDRRPYSIPDLQAYLAVLDTAEGADLDPGEREWRESMQGASESEPLRALLAVPLIVSDQVYGSIVFHYGEPRRFSEEDVQLGLALGDQAALAIENARLRAQAEEAAVAAERNRLARDLHDAVTQTLFSSSLIAEVLPRLWERSPEEGLRRLAELRELTRGALAEMRTLLLELRPSALMEANLRDLLRQLGESITGRARVPVEVEVTGECDLPPDIKVALYRIAQEALNNVAKHSRASQATVRLHCGAGEAELRIRDDGCGFDPQSVPPEHLGVGIMRERAMAIGAELSIHSELGGGTEVIVTWQEGAP